MLMFMGPVLLRSSTREMQTAALGECHGRTDRVTGLGAIEEGCTQGSEIGHQLRQGQESPFVDPGAQVREVLPSYSVLPKHLGPERHRKAKQFLRRTTAYTQLSSHTLKT